MAGERTGELTSVATQGVEALDVYFARYLPTAVVAAIAPPIVLAWVLWSDWRSFLILAVTVSVIPLFMVLLGLEARRHAERQWDRLSGLAAAFYDLLQGLPTLRAFGRAHAGRRTLEKAAEDFRVTTMSTLRIAFLSSLALEVLAAVGTALVALFLGLRLLDGTLHLAVALAVLVLAPEVYLPLRRAASEFHASTAGQAAADRILEVLDEPGPVSAVQADGGTGAAVPTATSTAAAASGAGSGAGGKPDLAALARSTIRLSDLEVRYAARGIPVLDGLNLEVAFGEHVAVTGESGSGKSTLLAVLLGLVAPVGGKLTVGGVELGDLPLRDWRRQIAWVPQRPYLVRGTIADNLRLGDAGASEKTLARAVEQSGLSGASRTAATRSRVPGRRGRPDAERRRAPAHRHRACHVARRSCRALGRADGASRHRPRTVTGRNPRTVAREPDRPRRRPPPRPRRACRPCSRLGRRPARRGR